MKMKAEVAAAIIAFISIVGTGFGWILSIENRLSSKASSASLNTEITRTLKSCCVKEMSEDKESLKQSVRDLKSELDTDIRIVRDRMYQLQYNRQPLPPAPDQPTG